jgi:hypothetical protein
LALCNGARTAIRQEPYLGFSALDDVYLAGKDANEDVHYDSSPLGHSKLPTTSRYTHVATVGVLKVGATPLHIEGVLSQFLHRYAEHYPNVQVQMTEGSGREILVVFLMGLLLFHSAALAE